MSIRRQERQLVAAMKAAAAWDKFVTDYVGCEDTDPADARARYRADLAAINEGSSDGE